MDFYTLCAAALDVFEQDMAKQFELRRGADILGAGVPLYAYYRKAEERAVLMMIKTGAQAVCYEHCFFFVRETVTEEDILELTSFAEKAHAELLHPEEPGHMFSFISMIILTGGIDRAAQKRLKRYSFVKQYPYGNQEGWSAIRLAACVLPGGKIYSNSLGSALKDRLKPSLKKLAL